MFMLDDGTLVLAATDLTNHLACPHLTQQRLAIARGERGKPRPADDPHADLIRDRGELHEREQLERLSAECGGHVDLSSEAIPVHARGARGGRRRHGAGDARRRAADLPGAVLRRALAGAGGLPAPGRRRRRDLGAHSYEVLDTKLARAGQAARGAPAQPLQPPARRGSRGSSRPRAIVILGDGDDQSRSSCGRYAALHRHVVARLERIVERAGVRDLPRAGRALRDLRARVGVPRAPGAPTITSASSPARAATSASGSSSWRCPPCSRLAQAAPETPIRGRSAPSASSCCTTRPRCRSTRATSGEPRHRHLAPARAAGYAAAPRPEPGRRLLRPRGRSLRRRRRASSTSGAGGRRRRGYECAWAHDADAEKAAFERFVDRVVELRARAPRHARLPLRAARALEAALALGRSTPRARTRSTTCCAASVLVDLYAVVARACRSARRATRSRSSSATTASCASRSACARAAARSSPTRPGSRPATTSCSRRSAPTTRRTAARRCRCATGCSTRCGPRPRREFGVDFDELPRTRARGAAHGAAEWLPDVRGADRTPARRACRRTATTTRRTRPSAACSRTCCSTTTARASPTWWRYFDLRGKPLAELFDERDALGWLDARREPAARARSSSRSTTRFTFPPQEFRLDPGDAEDPTTGESYKRRRASRTTTWSCGAATTQAAARAGGARGRGADRRRRCCARR